MIRERSLWMELVSFWKWGSEEFIHPFYHMRTQQDGDIYETHGVRSHQTLHLLAPWSWISQPSDHKQYISVVINYWVKDILDLDSEALWPCSISNGSLDFRWAAWKSRNGIVIAFLNLCGQTGCSQSPSSILGLTPRYGSREEGTEFSKCGWI